MKQISLVIMPPPPMKCQVEDCVYTTAVNLTTFDHQFRDLEFHLRMAHPQLAAQTAAPAPAATNPGGGGPKPDKLPAQPSVRVSHRQTGCGLRTDGQDTSAPLGYKDSQL